MADENKNFSVSKYLDDTGEITPAAEKALVDAALHEAELDEKYGNSEIRAGLEGAARGATLGLSDQLLATDPEAQQGLRERQERNPISAGVGEVAGSVAPLLASEGTSALATSVKAAGAPMIAVTEAGKLVEGATAKILGEFAADQGRKKLLTQILQKSIPTIAQGAVEGAAFGAGHEISENALGRADLTAENILASMGMGAALGGGINAGLSAASAALPVVSKGLKPITDNIKKAADKYLNPEEVVKEFSGFTPSDVVKIEKRNPNFFKDLPDFYASRIGLKPMDSADEVASKVSALKTSSGKKIGEISEQLQALSEVDNAVLPQREAVYGTFLKHLDEERAALMASPEVNAENIRTLNKFERDLTARGIENKPISFNDLNDLRKTYDKQSKFNQFATPAQNYKSQIASDLRSLLREQTDSLADTLSAATADATRQTLASELKQANKDYYMSSMLQEKVAKRAEKSGKFMSTKDLFTGGLYTLLGGPAVGVGTVAAKELLESDLRKKFVILSNIQKQSNVIDKKLTDSVKNFFKKSAKVTRPVTNKVLVNSWLARDEKTGATPKNRQVAFANMSNTVSSLVSDPNKLINRMAKGTSLVSKYAPKTASELQNRMVSAMQFLNSKMPKTNNGGADLLFKKPYEPSNLELAKFERYTQILEAPFSALDELQAGTLTRDHVEALKAVYPTLYSKIQSEVINEISQAPEDFSYNKRIQLGILMDLPTDESLRPYAIAGLQANFGPQPQPGSSTSPAGGAINPTAGGLKELNFANREATSVQQTQSRKLERA